MVTDRIVDYDRDKARVLRREGGVETPAHSISRAQRHTLSPRAGQVAVEPLLALLDCCTGHNFSHYKESLILRSLAAYMQQTGAPDLLTSTLCLETNPAMFQLFLSKLLVRVTHFFRDPEAFLTLGDRILPALLGDLAPGSTFRAWVPGCSTGEEACSLAMLLRELADQGGRPYDFRIFATDIDEPAIASAQSGVFSPCEVLALSPARRRRFFTKKPAGYQLTRELRAKIHFTLGNVQTQPSFSGLDLISCRNLLIYLDPELQDTLLVLFHRLLRPDGVLFLAPSESVGRRTDLFAPLSRKWKLYRATGSQSRSASYPASSDGTQGCHLDSRGWIV